MLQQYLPLAVLKLDTYAFSSNCTFVKLQQYLPLAVLKPWLISPFQINIIQVATVLTACGIETQEKHINVFKFLKAVATVLTACGIETNFLNSR